jgi:glycosyltransferase involved in cell wall biosynthesis
MKILMLGWELPPHNSGGLGVACYDLCKSLAANNAEIEFIVPYAAEHDIDFMTVTAAIPQNYSTIQRTGIAYDSHKYLDAEGAQVQLGINDQHQNYIRGVLELVDSRQFDVIHAHDWLTFRAALNVKRKTNKPLILHVHSVESDRSGNQYGNPLVRDIEATSLAMADQIIAVSNHTKNKIIADYGIPASAIDVVHNSIEANVKITDEIVNSYQYIASLKSQGYKVVVNIGRLTIQKGIPNLIKAAAKVLEVEPKVLFLIVGSGEQYHELVMLAAELGISDKVIFTEFQRSKKWRDAFIIGDLFVMPSVSEPFGLTPLEAISYGTPSLVSKQSGVSEVFKNCLKVDYWDIDEMANIITSAVSSPGLLDEITSKATDEYSIMSWDDSTNKLMSLYRHHRQLAEAAHFE